MGGQGWIAHVSRCWRLRIARQDFVGQALRPPPAGFQFKISARQAMRLSYNGFEP
ncbi:MAG: hypothetical protein Udaeo2_01070 [Candidatus Udaeobacter sp.]|jgi:hypothetical protein|nr:MAG: hypothetical protein Udaeo2_01070 [Candidatus Udaeobacter sp.]